MDISKEEHFARVRETTAVVWPSIELIIHDFLSKHNAKDIEIHLEVFLQKRRGRPLLRPYLARLAYEAVGGEFWDRMGSLFAAVELLNISTYQSNMCFDKKYEGWSGTNANNQFISSMLTLSLAINAVIAQQSISETSKLAAIQSLSQANSEVYLGQFIDLNTLSVNNVDHYLSSDPAFFEADYLKRCRLIGASMFRIACIGAYAVAQHPKQEIDLIRYFEALGIAGQVINDLADYIPDANRPYASQYDDLRMGRLTFPTYILARNKHPAITMDWNCNDIQNHLESATRELISIDIGNICLELLKRECWKPMRNALVALSSSVPTMSLQPFTFGRYFIFESRMLSYFINSKKKHSSSGGSSNEGKRMDKSF